MRSLLLLVTTSALICWPFNQAGADFDPSLHGFIEARGGFRTQSDSHEKDESLGEVRAQFESVLYQESYTATARLDLLYDEIAEDHDIDLETGAGWLDLREFNLLFTPANALDFKIGRQILTWGTGDLLFINDMFPKDWQSFFLGRDEEYLKAPSDAIMASYFSEMASLDLVFTPRFDADRYISGKRISYWNPNLGATAGQSAVIDAMTPEDWLEDHEFAARLHRQVGSIELALYGYHGYWKTPQGFHNTTGRAYFPRLSTYGASARGPWAGGIANLEAGWHDSRDDRSGNNPLIPNSELRLLAGYEREIGSDLTANIQYYLEAMLDYSTYRGSLPSPIPARDEYRHVATFRLTKLLLNQNLTLSLFAYYSPSDEDAYLRPAISYKLTDTWLVTTNGNIFIGREKHTFFGQFEDNTNINLGVRYSY